MLKSSEYSPASQEIVVEVLHEVCTIPSVTGKKVIAVTTFHTWYRQGSPKDVLIISPCQERTPLDSWLT